MRILPVAHYAPTLAGWLKNAAARRDVFPFYASFKVTARCRFACPFCNMKADRTGDLGTADVMRILDNLSRSSVLLTSFEGGEPLLRPDIGELLRYARTRKFYVLFTTSAKDLWDYPIREYVRWIDFFHVSIDEGHGNLEMLDTVLPRLTGLHPRVAVQTVVTDATLDALPGKVRTCHGYGASIVIMPAARMEGARDCFPDMRRLEARVEALRRAFPGTILTPASYFRAHRERRCSAASIIIGPDGRLFYPCHIRGERGPNLVETELRTWLTGPRAAALRARMSACDRACGWYQYFSVGEYARIAALPAVLKDLVRAGSRSGRRLRRRSKAAPGAGRP